LEYSWNILLISSSAVLEFDDKYCGTLMDNVYRV
jgi:hypothetical protein